MTSPLRFGVLGAGRIVVNSIIPALRRVEGWELAAVASRDVERAAALGPTRAYDSYDALIADPEIDVIYVATHNGLHAEQAIAAMRAGKHVLCEKPMGCTAAECEQMVAVARETGRHLIEAFMYQYHPQIAMVRKWLEEGRIGELRTVESSFSFPHSFPNDVRLNPEWGGGGILDVGCYTVSFCRLWLGDEPQSLVGKGWLHPQHGVDFSAQAILDYGEGRYGVVSCGFDAGLRCFGLLVGTEGTIHLDRPFISWDQAPRLTLRVGEDHEEVHVFHNVDVYELQLRELLAVVRDGAEPRIALDHGLKNLRILDAWADQIRQP